MSDHLPEPAELDPHDHPEIAARNARVGLVLFEVYLVFYGAFIGLSAFAADLMQSRPFGGVNLAVLFGLGLIVLALLLAAVYTALCRSTRTADPGRR